jgi:hypothetical protein
MVLHSLHITKSKQIRRYCLGDITTTGGYVPKVGESGTERETGIVDESNVF